VHTDCPVCTEVVYTCLCSSSLSLSLISMFNGRLVSHLRKTLQTPQSHVEHRVHCWALLWSVPVVDPGGRRAGCRAKFAADAQSPHYYGDGAQASVLGTNLWCWGTCPGIGYVLAISGGSRPRSGRPWPTLAGGLPKTRAIIPHSCLKHLQIYKFWVIKFPLPCNIQ